MALQRPLAFGHEVHLQVGQVRRAAQEVMAHQPVEVVRGRGADVLLHVDDGLILQRGRGQRRGDPRGGFKCRTLRHVDHHLELALVVERQHLDSNQLERHECHGGQQQDGHAAEKYRTHPATRNQRSHDAPIEAREEILFAMVVMRRRFQDPHRRPRCDHEGHDEGENHCRRRADRNRAHVRAHQAADEGHGQNGRHHGECGQDGGVAHLVHGTQCHGGKSAGPAWAQSRVPHDVLHHHDRVVHENADREDQREERDAVEGVAVEKEHEQRQRQRDRNGGQYHRGLAPAQNQPDQRRH